MIAWFIWFAFGLVPPDQPLLRLLPLGMAVAVGFMMSPMYVDLFAKDPILAISIEGVYFQLYSPKTIPWADIESVTVRRGYWQTGKGKYARYSPHAASDAVSFRVRTPSFYPNRPGVLGAKDSGEHGAEHRHPDQHRDCRGECG